MKIGLMILLAAWLAGCATVADIRSQTPDLVMESALPPQQLAQCVNFKAPAMVSTPAVPHYHFVLSEEPNGTYHLLAEIPGQPSGEAVFIPNDQGGSHIELRARWNFWGKEAFWQCIQTCASQAQSPGATAGVK